MTDTLNEQQRHYNMSRIRSKDTKPEEIVRKYLFSKGLRFRKNDRRYPGHPDVVLPKYKTVVFVNGCFWHRCPHCGLSMPKSNVEFWEAKFARNRARDARDNALLVSGGWTVITIWECRLKKGRFDATMRELVREVRRAEELRAQGLRSGRLVEIGSAPAWRVRRERHRRRGRRG